MQKLILIKDFVHGFYRHSNKHYVSAELIILEDFLEHNISRRVDNWSTFEGGYGESAYAYEEDGMVHFQYAFENVDIPTLSVSIPTYLYILAEWEKVRQNKPEKIILTLHDNHTVTIEQILKVPGNTKILKDSCDNNRCYYLLDDRDAEKNRILLALLNKDISTQTGCSHILATLDSSIAAEWEGSNCIIIRDDKQVTIQKVTTENEVESSKTQMPYRKMRNLFLQMEGIIIENPDCAYLSWHEDGAATLEWESTACKTISLKKEVALQYAPTEKQEDLDDLLFFQFFNTVLSLFESKKLDILDWLWNQSTEEYEFDVFYMIIKNNHSIIIKNSSYLNTSLSLSLDSFLLILNQIARIHQEQPSYIFYHKYSHAIGFAWDRDEDLQAEREEYRARNKDSISIERKEEPPSDCELHKEVCDDGQIGYRVKNRRSPENTLLNNYFLGELKQPSDASRWLEVTSDPGVDEVAADCIKAFKTGNYICLTDLMYSYEIERNNVFMPVSDMRTFFLQHERLLIEQPEKAYLRWYDNCNFAIDWESTCIKQVILSKVNDEYLVDSDHNADKLLTCFLNQLISLLHYDPYNDLSWLWSRKSENRKIKKFTFVYIAKQDHSLGTIHINHELWSEVSVVISCNFLDLMLCHAKRILKEQPAQVLLKWYDHGVAFEWEVDK